MHSEGSKVKGGSWNFHETQISETNNLNTPKGIIGSLEVHGNLMVELMKLKFQKRSRRKLVS